MNAGSTGSLKYRNTGTAEKSLTWSPGTALILKPTGKISEQQQDQGVVNLLIDSKEYFFTGTPDVLVLDFDNEDSESTRTFKKMEHRGNHREEHGVVGSV
jgi:hypothetical protein